MRKNLVYFLLFTNPQRARWFPDDYLEQLRVCLHSLRKTSDPASFDVLFLADDAKAEAIAALPEVAGLTHHVRRFTVPADLREAMCTRFRLHEMMGEDLARYDKVLYADIDIVFLRDVRALFDAVTDPGLVYVKPDHWCGTSTESKWFSLGHPEDEQRRFAEQGILDLNSGQFAFVNGPPMAALFADLCAGLPDLIPRSRLGFDQPILNSFLRSRHLAAPCLDQRALDALCHLEGEEQPRTDRTVLVHFIKANKLPRMQAEMGIAPAATAQPAAGRAFDPTAPSAAAPRATTPQPRATEVQPRATAPQPRATAAAPQPRATAAAPQPRVTAAAPRAATPEAAPRGALAQAMQHHQQGRLREAEALYRKALGEQPDHAQGRGLFGYLLFQTGRAAEALPQLDRALSLRPAYAEAHAWRGLALARLGRQEEAVGAYGAAIQADPKHAGAHNNLGLALFDLRRNREAIPHFERAVALGYKRPEPFVMMGRAHVKLGHLAEAERAYREALRQKASFVDARLGLANVLHDLGDLDAAIAELRRAIKDDPAALGARSNLVMKLLYHDGLDPRTVAEEHQAAGQAYARAFAGQGDPAWQKRDLDPDRPLRIGYMSPDFHLHATAFFLEPLFAGHDPAAVEIHVYSSTELRDEMTDRLRGHARGWRDVFGRSGAEVAALVAEDRIDVLVDCAGHTNGNRLGVLAMKPAPIQVTWLGYPHGTGVPAVDYRLTDALADPPGMTESHYVEELVRLPEGTFSYRAPDFAPEPAPGPLARGEGPVFGCFNNPHKIGPEVIRLWADVVNAVPGSRLRLKARQFLDAGAAARFRERFAAAGLAPERLEIEGRRTLKEGFAEYATIDVALDPFPYHGTTSTCESLWMGVPVVTLPGRSCVSRVGPSLLARVGVDDLVARDAAHYREIAAGLIADPARLAELRQALRGRMAASALGDGPRFARQMEAAYRTMWRKHCGA
jgi:predicted O-linked N-acetylglucosamine transferase (SPINDLY family)